jgi:hypothetical protein
VLDDRIAEVLGLSWVAYQRGYEKGRNPHELISTIAGFAIKKSRVGRQITSQEATKDALSPSAHRKHGFKPEYLTDLMRGRTEASVSDQVADRLDYRSWRDRLSEKKRKIVDDLALGDTTNELAAKHGLSAGRISQIRKEPHDDW